MVLAFRTGALRTIALACLVHGCARVHDPADGRLDASVPATGDATAADASDAADAADAARVCVATCVADVECEESCPASASGPSCCDRRFGRCFAAMGPACPTATDEDAATPSPVDAGPTRTCVAFCTNDAQCAASCPPSPLGANCCDPAEARCVVVPAGICPGSELPDAGVCTASCDTDADCLARCPPANCCDTHVCRRRLSCDI